MDVLDPPLGSVPSSAHVQNLDPRISAALGLRPTKKEDELLKSLDRYSLEDLVDFKISRFLDQLGGFYPDHLHDIILQQVEKPLIKQILRRTGGNQVHAARNLGINRNTLRKKIKQFNI